MFAAKSPVAFGLMGKRTAITSDKEPINARISGPLLDRARAWISRQPVKPSLTAVIEAALAKWLDEFEPESKKPSK